MYNDGSAYGSISLIPVQYSHDCKHCFLKQHHSIHVLYKLVCVEEGLKKWPCNCPCMSSVFHIYFDSPARTAVRRLNLRDRWPQRTNKIW